MLNNFPKARAGERLDVIKFVADLKKYGNTLYYKRVISIWEIVSFNAIITGGIQVSILSTSLRWLIKYNVLIEDAAEAEEFLETEGVDEFLEAAEVDEFLETQKHSRFEFYILLIRSKRSSLEVFVPFNFELGKRYIQTFWVFLFLSLGFLANIIAFVIQFTQNAKGRKVITGRRS